MELKPKYNYTYFIKPFIMEEQNYKKFLTKIINEKKFHCKIFEKQADLDLYNFFLPEIRDEFFINNKSDKLERQDCIIFDYNFLKDTPGKIGDDNGIFFDIEKIELVCFNTGICFLLIKTYLDKIKEFSEILNFNYKFRQIDYDNEKFRSYEKIKIQTGAFNNSNEFKDFIYNLVGKINDLEFYVYSYTCIDGESWNDKITFDDLKVDFWKYSNILPSSYNIDVNLENKIPKITNWQYAQFGFNENACVLLTSSLNSYNYTKLPYEYENQYLYTYIWALYQKICLNKLIKDLKDNKKFGIIQKNLNIFIKRIWIKEFTKEQNGVAFSKKMQEILELDNLFLELLHLYDLELKKHKKVKMKAIYILLTICIMLNIINLCLILIK